MIEFYKGDLLQSGCDIICHQVNCMGAMRSGIAKQIRTIYPKVYTEYKTWCGLSSPGQLLGRCQLVRLDSSKAVANIFGQLYYGYSGERFTDYKALETAFTTLRDGVKFENPTNYKNIRIGIPKNIGCGLGGGDWSVVLDIIHRVFDSEDFKIEIWEL